MSEFSYPIDVQYHHYELTTTKSILEVSLLLFQLKSVI